TTARGPVEAAGMHFRADEQDAAVLPHADPCVRHGEAVQEAAALIADVDRRDAREAELALQEYAVAGLEVIGRAGAVHDAVEIARLEAGLGERPAGGLAREARSGLAVAHPVAGADAAALRDPLVRGVHHLGQVLVRDAPRGDVEGGGDELGAGHGSSGNRLRGASEWG